MCDLWWRVRKKNGVAISQWTGKKEIVIQRERGSSGEGSYRSYYHVNEHYVLPRHQQCHHTSWREYTCRLVLTLVLLYFVTLLFSMSSLPLSTYRLITFTLLQISSFSLTKSFLRSAWPSKSFKGFHNFVKDLNFKLEVIFT